MAAAEQRLRARRTLEHVPSGLERLLLLALYEDVLFVKYTKDVKS